MAENTGGASLKAGIVSATRKMHARVRFDDLDGLETAWLPVLCRNSLSNKEYCPFDIGEQVWCALDEYFESGVILGAVYSDADAEAETSQDVVSFKWPDGGLVRYNRSTGDMDIAAAGKLTVNATGEVNVMAPQVKLDTPMTICTGQLVVQGLFTWQAGMSGYGAASGAGAQAVIRCSMRFENGAGINVTDADVTVQGKSFLPHYHHTYALGADTSAVV